jgi:hypothetical protein
VAAILIMRGQPETHDNSAQKTEQREEDSLSLWRHF